MNVLLVLSLLTSLPACYAPPVIAPIVDPFIAPVCPYCAGGHRGLEYDVAVNTVVRAVAAGTVTFSGLVAGVRYVVVLQEDGLRATYGMLHGADVHQGVAVRPGEPIGTTNQHFYFGLRRGEEYIDPQPLLGVVTRRARLVPLDGSGRRPARPGPIRCLADSRSR